VRFLCCANGGGRASIIPDALLRRKTPALLPTLLLSTMALRVRGARYRLHAYCCGLSPSVRLRTEGGARTLRPGTTAAAGSAILLALPSCHFLATYPR